MQAAMKQTVDINEAVLLLDHGLELGHKGGEVELKWLTRYVHWVWTL